MWTEKRGNWRRTANPPCCSRASRHRSQNLRGWHKRSGSVPTPQYRANWSGAVTSMLQGCYATVLKIREPPGWPHTDPYLVLGHASRPCLSYTSGKRGTPVRRRGESWRLAFFHLERRPTKLAGRPTPRKTGHTGSPGPRPYEMLVVSKFAWNLTHPGGCPYYAFKYSHICLQPGYHAKHPQHQHQTQEK